MFTGIIEETAAILARDERLLKVERPKVFDDVKIGSSIAVSGVCLTVTSLNESSLGFDVVPTTLRKATLGGFKEGDRVNLERAMRADSRFGGHVVQGHSEGVAELATKRADPSQPGYWLFTFSLPDALTKLVVTHGSITLDGVSLTVATLEKNLVTVALIPHTLAATTFGTLKEGQGVNVETDIMGRYLLATASLR